MDQTRVLANNSHEMWWREGAYQGYQKRPLLGGSKRNEEITGFRFVFLDVLPFKIIVDRRFRDTCCLHHQGYE
jgi:hypothetical protein